MEVAETGCINLRGLYPIVECRYTIAVPTWQENKRGRKTTTAENV